MNILYTVLIQPLVSLYDVLFTLIYSLIEQPVPAIALLSLAVNLLVLPLYRKADLMQKAEQEKAYKMKPWLDHIRKNFSGDERFMMQAAYYRLEHYNPLSALTEAGPLLLQIPFFIAAYRYIASIPLLEGASFGPIPDLLGPDGLLKIGDTAINILPMLMTAINCASGYIYSKDGTMRQKVQIYGTALLFLVLLYNSPSALVLYWIANQCFSLCKNLYFIHGKESKWLLATAAAVITVPLVFLLMLEGGIDTEFDIFLSECVLFCAFIIIVRAILIQYKVEKPYFLIRFSDFMDSLDVKSFLPQILLSGICLALLMGFFIPSAVLSSSVHEFVDKTTGTFQYKLLWYPALVYTGFFVIWVPVILLALDGRERRNLVALVWILLGISLVNQFLFDPDVGVLYSDLVFDGQLRFGVFKTLLNILACSATGGLFLFIFIRHPSLMKRIAVVTAAALFLLSAGNIMTIYQDGSQDIRNKYNEDSNRTFKLSKKGQNVVVVMLDRAIGGYAPYIFNEKPDLKKAFQGFVYYPNTVSFGPYTNMGAPGLFGGYEYTPLEMNKRDTVSLKNKHDEALTLMPALFSRNGFKVTICDPPYAGYKDNPDLSIYDIYPEVTAYNLSGRFSARFGESMRDSAHGRQQHNFMVYSMFRVAPLFMKNYLYDNGRYLAYDNINSYTSAFIDEYAVLDALPELTAVVDDDDNHLLMIQNSTTHEPVPLFPPDYNVDGRKPSEELDYEDYILDGRTMRINDSSHWNHYCVNMAAYREIAAWLDYMKEQGVYDNTRIIIAADHGRNLNQFPELVHPDGLDVERVWPLLLLKDFNMREPLTADMIFMTNADVPTLAMKDIIDNPINPFTGNPVNDSLKKEGNLYLMISELWDIDKNNGTTFLDDDVQWWSVHDNIFNMDNWKKLGGEAVR